MKLGAVAALCSAALFLTCAPAAETAPFSACISASAENSPQYSVKVSKIQSQGGKVSQNAGANDYSGNWARVVRSYIYEDSSGRPVRLELVNGSLTAETYSRDGKTVESTVNITQELPKFGGAFFGKSFNFLVFAADNPTENDTQTFLTVVKYNKNWQRLGSCELAAEEVAYMFDFGSLRMCESGGMLYIHTCYRRYKNNGVNTQSSFTISVNENDMSWDRDVRPYMSHSFNQFVRVNGKTEYLLDHGDYAGRSVRLTAVPTDAPSAEAKKIDILKIGSSFTELGTKTGVQVGGMEVGSSVVITAGCMTDQNNLATSTQKNVFVCLTQKDLSSSRRVMLTEYGENAAVVVGNPQLVDLGADRFAVLWEEVANFTRKLHAALVTGSGTVIKTSLELADTRLSDCTLVKFSDGTVKWYYTNGGSPVFCTLSTAVTGGLPGDLNDDNKVDINDLTLMQKLNAGWKVSANTDNADVNKDGSVTVNDLVLLQKFVAGWKVILK